MDVNKLKESVKKTEMVLKDCSYYFIEEFLFIWKAYEK